MAAAYAYMLYGLSLRSEWALPCFDGTDPGLPQVELLEGSARLFSAASREADRRAKGPRWSYYLPLPGGAEYLRWTNLFEFLVSADGRRIIGRPLADASPEAFHTYLLGQVLSHALIKLGFEPIHATVVEVGGEGVGFMGDSGSGKSTLAAAFIRAGSRLLTDDLLVLDGNAAGIWAHPGVPRIKLFPKVARTLLGERVRGAAMNPLTSKLVIPLDRMRWLSQPISLRRFYVLRTPVDRSPRPRVTIRRASSRRAFLELLRNTYNRDVVETRRLERQLVVDTRVATNVRLSLLTFHRRLSCLPAVHAAILSDLGAS